MTPASVLDLKDIMRRATEAVADVPESLRPVAFQEAVRLLSGGPQTTAAAPARRSQGMSNSRSSLSTPHPDDGAQLVATLDGAIDRTKYPGIKQQNIPAAASAESDDTAKKAGPEGHPGVAWGQPSSTTLPPN